MTAGAPAEEKKNEAKTGEKEVKKAGDDKATDKPVEKEAAPAEEAKAEAPADLIWGGNWKKYTASREKKNDCELNESVNWLGTGMCKYSWECKGARMCEDSGWCKGQDACDEVMNTQAGTV